MTSLIVEADGGARGNPGPAAFGALVRDAATGAVLAERGERIGVASNNVAEYRGLIAGLTACAAIDPDADVEVRMDSKLVVEQMSGRWKIKHPDMRELALQARRILPIDHVRYTWVPREANRAADALVNAALDVGPVHRDHWAGGDDDAPGDDADPSPLAGFPGATNAIPGFSPLGDPTTLYLLRHGETPHTAQKRFSGSGGADPGLTTTGRAQAEAAAAALTGRDIAAVITSPLTRTQETAAIVADALGLMVQVDEAFAECAFGQWDGLTFAEVAAGWPDHLAEWLASTSVAPPGGESVDAVTARVAAGRERVVADHAGATVLVVTHVTPIKSLVRLTLGAPADAVYRMQLAPASFSRIDHYDDGNVALRGFAVDSHLR